MRTPSSTDIKCRALMDALLDTVAAGMERWQCGPEEAVARLRALQQAAAVAR